MFNRHAGRVPASTVPRAHRHFGLRRRGSRDKPGVTFDMVSIDLGREPINGMAAIAPVADVTGAGHDRQMIKLQVFKSLDRRTASVELWQGDMILAEVFADEQGTRRLYVAGDSEAPGLNWANFMAVAPRITELLDEADMQMQQTREHLGEA
jgi:hypothetical protein